MVFVVVKVPFFHGCVRVFPQETSILIIILIGSCCRLASRKIEALPSKPLLLPSPVKYKTIVMIQVSWAWHAMVWQEKGPAWASESMSITGRWRAEVFREPEELVFLWANSEELWLQDHCRHGSRIMLTTSSRSKTNQASLRQLSLFWKARKRIASAQIWILWQHSF